MKGTIVCKNSRRDGNIVHYRQCSPKTSQQSALVALTGMRQGLIEEISSYICKFEAVITWFIGDHMQDDTIRYHFIQRFNQATRLRTQIFQGTSTRWFFGITLHALADHVAKDYYNLYQGEKLQKLKDSLASSNDIWTVVLEINSEEILLQQFKKIDGAMSRRMPNIGLNHTRSNHSYQGNGEVIPPFLKERTRMKTTSTCSTKTLTSFQLIWLQNHNLVLA